MLKKNTSKINKKLAKSSVLTIYTNHSSGSLLHKHKTIQFDVVEERPLKCNKLRLEKGHRLRSQSMFFEALQTEFVVLPCKW